MTLYTTLWRHGVPLAVAAHYSGGSDPRLDRVVDVATGAEIQPGQRERQQIEMCRVKSEPLLTAPSFYGRK